MSGTCKQEDADEHLKLISRVISACKAETSIIGCPLYCIASDGESRRGSALSALTEKRTLSEVDKLSPLLGGMKLFNLLIGDNNITVDKDPKHIFKQCRNFLLRKSGVQVNCVHISTTLVRLHLKRSGIPDIHINNLLNPADRQDVPTCFTLLKEIWSLKDPAVTDKPSFIAARRSLQLLGELFRHLVLPFVQITLSLQEQLTHLSATVHLAAFLFTANKAHNKAMPSLTYRDIILMVKNAYICVVKAKLHDPIALFFLILLGTDRLEDDFGLVRSIVGNNANADIFSLSTRFSHTVEVRNIFSKYTKWDRGPRQLCLWAIEDGNGNVLAAVDHIGPASWKEDVQLSNVSPITAWNAGWALVEEKFPHLKVAEYFLEMEKIGADLYFPFGKDVELPADGEGDDNGDDDHEERTQHNSQTTELVSLDTISLDENPSNPLNFEDQIGVDKSQQGRGQYDAYVDAGNGKMVSKARTLREMERFLFSKLPGSTD